MTSARWPAARMARTTSSPWRSGRFMSSSTTSIALSCNAFSAACDVPTVAATSKPSTLPTYAVWASAAIGSSSTTRTRSTPDAPPSAIGPPERQPHHERCTGWPRDLERPAEAVDRLAHQGQPDPAAPGTALLLRRPTTPEGVADGARRQTRPVVGDLEHGIRPLNPRVEAHAAFRLLRPRLAGHGVEGVVDEVADDGDEVAGRRHVARPVRTGCDLEGDATLVRLGGLAEEQGRQGRLVDGADDAVGEHLRDVQLVGGEVERPV